MPSRQNEIVVFRLLPRGPEVERTLSIAGIRPASAAFGPKGSGLFAVGDLDGTINVWKGEELLFTTTGHKGAIKSLVFGPGGLQLASGGVDAVINLWGIPERKQLYELKGHRSMVTALAFAPDRLILASGSYDGTAKRWDPKGGAWTPKTLTERQAPISSIAFRPDKKKIAVADYGGSIAVMDLENPGEPIIHLLGHREPVWSLSFNRAGTMLVSAGLGDRVFVWNVHEETWQRVACGYATERSGQEVLKRDWAKILVDEPYRDTCSDILQSKTKTGTVRHQ